MFIMLLLLGCWLFQIEMVIPVLTRCICVPLWSCSVVYRARRLCVVHKFIAVASAEVWLRRERGRVASSTDGSSYGVILTPHKKGPIYG